jgi:hypothetical protein
LRHPTRFDARGSAAYETSLNYTRPSRLLRLGREFEKLANGDFGGRSESNARKANPDSRESRGSAHVFLIKCSQRETSNAAARSVTKRLLAAEWRASFSFSAAAPATFRCSSKGPEKSIHPHFAAYLQGETREEDLSRSLIISE